MRNLGIALVGTLLACTMAWAGGDYHHTENLLHTRTTVVGEAIHYPGGGEAEITSRVVIIPPGEQTIWHQHGVPLYAYLLAGQLEVDYGEAGTRRFGPGEAFMEAMSTWHRGRNVGEEPVRILTVFMGGHQQPLVVGQESAGSISWTNSERRP